MNNKKQKAILFLFGILLTAGFFGFTSASHAEKSVTISAIQISGNNANDDYIELYNRTCQSIDLSDWKLKKRTTSGTESFIGTLKNSIPAKGYFLWENTTGTLADNPDYATKTYYLSTNYGLALFGKDGNQIDAISWGDANPFPDSFPYPNPGKLQSLRIDPENNYSLESGYSPKNSSVVNTDELTTCPPPAPDPEPIEYSDQILIDEVLPNPVGSSESKNEFIELYNFGDADIDLDKWYFSGKSGTFTLSGTLKPGEYKAFRDTITLYNSASEIKLFNPNDELVDTLDYPDPSGQPEGYFWSFDPDSGNWDWTSINTENKKNQFDPETPPTDESGDSGDNTPPPTDDTPSDHKVYLNEILPNPKGADKSKEFIEIYNAEDAPIDLKDWTLKYASSTYHFPDETTLDAGKFLTVYNDKDFKFSLGNSGNRTLSLFDKDGKKSSTVSWSTAKEAVSYNFDGAFWHWSRKLTPGEENKFNHAPKIKINKIKAAFVGVPLTFSLSAKDKDKDKLKYVWDFGDKHKSYLKNPTHIFLKKKDYHVILTVDDGSEKFAKTLSVKVKKYPQQDVRIVQLNPNPAGKDTGNEKITLLNNSKKKINLKGWKIATGTSNKKLINHIIAADFFIPAGKPADLTHLNAFFYLNNKAMKLELHYPDGKTADKLAYSKDKIADDEIYKKTGSQWAWIAPPNKTELAFAPNPAEPAPIVTVTTAETPDNLGKYTANPELEKKNEYRVALANYSSNIIIPKITPEPSGRVLGASTVRETADIFAFTQPLPPEKHWLVKLFDYLAISANALANKLFLRFN